MKVPVGTSNGLYYDVDGRSTILEFHMETWKVVFLTVFFNMNMLEPFAPSMNSVMEQTALAYSNVRDIPPLPFAMITTEYGC